MSDAILAAVPVRRYILGPTDREGREAYLFPLLARSIVVHKLRFLGMNTTRLLVLSLFFGLHSAGGSAAAPSETLHRKNAGTFDANGLVFAQSTEGRFSV